jgi:hypothetical protein
MLMREALKVWSLMPSLCSRKGPFAPGHEIEARRQVAEGLFAVLVAGIAEEAMRLTCVEGTLSLDDSRLNPGVDRNTE